MALISSIRAATRLYKKAASRPSPSTVYLTFNKGFIEMNPSSKKLQDKVTEHTKPIKRKETKIIKTVEHIRDKAKLSMSKKLLLKDQSGRTR